MEASTIRDTLALGRILEGNDSRVNVFLIVVRRSGGNGCAFIVESFCGKAEERGTG